MIDLDYPPRSLAEQIIALMAEPTTRDWDQVAAAVGLESGIQANIVAHRCYQVHGYRALLPNAVALWTVERSMLPRAPLQASPEPEQRPTFEPIGYGFNPSPWRTR